MGDGVAVIVRVPVAVRVDVGVFVSVVVKVLVCEEVIIDVEMETGSGGKAVEAGASFMGGVGCKYTGVGKIWV